LTSRSARTSRFEELYRSTYPNIVRYCARRLRSSLVEDAVADIFAVAWRKRRAFLAADEPLAWLYAVGFRVVSARYRKLASDVALSEALMHEPTRPIESVPREAEGRSDVERAFRALSRLSVEDRELIMLAGWEGLGGAEVARVIGKKPEAARSALHRARQRLQAVVAEMEGGNA